MPASNSMVDKIPAEMINQYYYSSKNVKRSKIDTYQTTNAIYNLNSLTPGSTSTVVVPSNAGLSHFILSATLPAPAGSLTYNGLALPTGWLYNFIDNITYRYAGSSQWSATGDMLKICAAVNAGNANEKQNIIDIGGGALFTPAHFASEVNRTGACVLTIGHVSSQSGSEVPLPLDSSLLQGGPVTITITWKQFSDVFASAFRGTGGDGVAISPLPTAFSASALQVRQVLPLFRDDLLKLSGDQAYRYPIKWYQPENRSPLATPDFTVAKQATQTVNMVGIKQGDCLGVYCWITKTNTTAPGAGPTVSAGDLIKANGSTYVPMGSAIFSYAGTQLQVFQSVATSALLDVLYTDCPSFYDTANIGINIDNDNNGVYFGLVPGNSAVVSYFTHAPFSQRVEQSSGLGGSFVIQNGVGLNNGSVSVELTIADPNPVAGDAYTFHYMPYFNAALSFQGQQVDYLF